MSSEYIASCAFRSFEDFVAGTPTSGLSGMPGDCLADYIYAWVRCGCGVRACRGDFPTFMVAVVAIIERWLEKDGALNYVGDDPDCETIVKRRVTALFTYIDRRPTRSRRILDRDFFEAHTFYELHGGDIEEKPT